MIFALEDDLRLRGLNAVDLKGDIKKLSYDGLICSFFLIQLHRQWHQLSEINVLN